MTKQTTMVTVIVVIIMIIMRTHHIAALFLLVAVLGRQNPQLARGVSEKANFSLAILPILASLGSIP